MFGEIGPKISLLQRFLVRIGFSDSEPKSENLIMSPGSVKPYVGGDYATAMWGNTYYGYKSGNPDGNTVNSGGNTIIGDRAGFSMTDASSNVFIGQQAARSATTAISSVVIGYAGAFGQGTALTTGSGLVCLGYQAGVSSASSSNRISIGQNTVCTADNSAQIGDANLTLLTVGTSNTASVKALNTAKFYIKVTGATGARVDAGSFNVSSITDNAAGDITININTDFANSSYTAQVAVEMTSTSYSVANARNPAIYNTGQAAGTLRVVCLDDTVTNNLLKDPQAWHVIGWGSQ